MAENDLLEDSTQSIAFAQFWAWVQGHANCILRVATANAVIFDDDDYHWHFGVESEESYVVQVIRGKRFVGELVLPAPEIAMVRYTAGEQEEHLFDMYDEENRFVCQFVLSHTYGDKETVSAGRLVH